jgi:hypothetical protein
LHLPQPLGVRVQIFTDLLIPDIIRMISTNMFRALPPQNEEFDPDEDEPSLEPSWPHLQARFVFSPLRAAFFIRICLSRLFMSSFFGLLCLRR